MLSFGNCSLQRMLYVRSVDNCSCTVPLFTFRWQLFFYNVSIFVHLATILNSASMCVSLATICFSASLCVLLATVYLQCLYKRFVSNYSIYKTKTIRFTVPLCAFRRQLLVLQCLYVRSVGNCSFALSLCAFLCQLLFTVPLYAIRWQLSFSVTVCAFR